MMDIHLKKLIILCSIIVGVILTLPFPPKEAIIICTILNINFGLNLTVIVNNMIILLIINFIYYIVINLYLINE